LPEDVKHWEALQPDGIRALYVESVERLGPKVKALLGPELTAYVDGTALPEAAPKDSATAMDTAE